VDPIRNLVAERAISRRPAVCGDCGLSCTAGELKTHRARCPKRVVACVAAAEGCPWSGANAAGEARAHEASCPYAIARRIVAPLRAELREARAERNALAARLGDARLMYPASGLRATADGHWRVSDRAETFATAGAPDVRLRRGRWFYEVAIVEEPVFPQVGWASAGFAPNNAAGVGDCPRSYACDGDRQKLWHDSRHDDFGDPWESGDVVTCFLDVDEAQIHFAVNGEVVYKAGADDGDPAFGNFDTTRPFFPALTMKTGLVRVNFGARPFDYGADSCGMAGYHAVAHAALYDDGDQD
jgi:hypothetical protein